MKFVRKITFIMTFALALIIANNRSVELVLANDRASEALEDAKNGIVEIQTGFFTEDGCFHAVKNCSGFVVNSGDNAIYVVTVNRTTKLSEKEKKKYCKENKIKEDVARLSTQCELVVSNDVITNLYEVASSEEENFCILNSTEGVREKKSIPLENREEIKVGDIVYSLGFPSQGDQELSFQLGSVSLNSGNILEADYKVGRSHYIKHSSTMEQDLTGGPLISSEGYVIGMNDYSLKEGDMTDSCALNIGRIITVLESYGIYYRNHETDYQIQELQKTVDKYQDLLESAKYKENSKRKMKNLLSDAEAMIADQANYTSDDFVDINKEIEQAQTSLVETTPIYRIIQLVLAIIDGVCFLVFLVAFIICCKSKKRLKQCKIDNQKSVSNDPNIKQKQSGNETSMDDRIRKINRQSSPSMPAQMQSGMVQLQNSGMPLSQMQQVGSMGMQRQGVQAQGNISGQMWQKLPIEIQKSSDAHDDITQNFASVNQFSARPGVAGGQFLMGDGQKTEILPENNMAIGYLVSQRTGGRYMLYKERLLVGKAKEQVDILIDGNPAISRVHACIAKNGGNYFIQDFGSVNGTRLNGSPLGTYTYQLNHNDIIEFADETYIFLLELQ